MMGTMREQQQKRRVMNALHQAFTNAHHSMLLATFANHRASKCLQAHFLTVKVCQTSIKQTLLSMKPVLKNTVTPSTTQGEKSQSKSRSEGLIVWLT